MPGKVNRVNFANRFCYSGWCINLIAYSFTAHIGEEVRIITFVMKCLRNISCHKLTYLALLFM